jgi:hypothetical protein
MRGNFESHDVDSQEHEHDLQIDYDIWGNEELVYNDSSRTPRISSAAHEPNARVASSHNVIEARGPPYEPAISESSGSPEMTPDPTMVPNLMDTMWFSNGSTTLSSSLAASCEVIVPTAILIRCPCCPFNTTLPRFLLEPKETLPLGLKEHILQEHGFDIPNHPQAEAIESDMYPGCAFPSCTEAPKHPWLHIRNKHLGVKMDWRCRCQPKKTFASRTSLCNHIARVRKASLG